MNRTSSRKPWRYRRCPVCRQVMPSSQILFVGEYGGPNWQEEGNCLRQCPSCLFVGQTKDFPVEIQETNSFSL